MCRLHAGREQLARGITQRGQGGSWSQPGDPLLGQSATRLLQITDEAAASAAASEDVAIGHRHTDTDGHTVERWLTRSSPRPSGRGRVLRSPAGHLPRRDDAGTGLHRRQVHTGPRCLVRRPPGHCRRPAMSSPTSPTGRRRGRTAYRGFLAEPLMVGGDERRPRPRSPVSPAASGSRRGSRPTTAVAICSVPTNRLCTAVADRVSRRPGASAGRNRTRGPADRPVRHGSAASPAAGARGGPPRSPRRTHGCRLRPPAAEPTSPH